MLRGHLEMPAHKMPCQQIEVGRIAQGHIVTNSRGHKELDAFSSGSGFGLTQECLHQRGERAVVEIDIGTDIGMDAAGAGTDFRTPTPHAEHIGRRSPDIDNRTPKVRVTAKAFGLPQHGVGGTGTDHLALMTANRAKGAAAKTTPMGDDRKLHRLQGRNTTQGVIAPMRPTREGQRIKTVQFLLAERLRRGVDHHGTRILILAYRRCWNPILHLLIL